jgi:hypothetical protein
MRLNRAVHDRGELRIESNETYAVAHERGVGGLNDTTDLHDPTRWDDYAALPDPDVDEIADLDPWRGDQGRAGHREVHEPGRLCTPTTQSRASQRYPDNVTQVDRVPAPDSPVLKQPRHADLPLVVCTA